MKKALTLFSNSRPFPAKLEPLLAAEGLCPHPVNLASLFEQAHDDTACLLLLDNTLLTSLNQKEQERLGHFCRRRNLPVLLSDKSSAAVVLPDNLPWTYKIIRNTDNLEEWADTIAAYLHIGTLEQEVADLQNKIEAHWREDEDELRSAAQIQQSLLPKNLPELSHFNVSCHFHPFEKIGGDLFNLRQVDEETLMLFLLDVSGHGISSAMVSVSVHQSLSLQTGQIVKRSIDRPPYYRLLSPVEVMLALADEYPFERFEMFFTIVYMLININTGQVRYCSAGHPPPILLRETGVIQHLTTGGGLIGLPDTGPFEQGELMLESCDRLFLYSDGLLDHTDVAGNCFGEHRLLQSLTRNGASLEKSCQAAIDDMYNFRGKLPAQDDVSLLGIEFTRPDNQVRP